MLENPLNTENSKMTSDRLFHPAYFPPEAIPWFGDYDAILADSWALGILLYKMVAGRYPYMDNQYHRILLQPTPMPNFLSDSLKSLLYMLLQKDITKRILIKNVLHHPWCKTDGNSLVPRNRIFD